MFDRGADTVDPRALVVVTVDGERCAGELFGVEAVVAYLWIVATGRQTTGYSF